MDIDVWFCSVLKLYNFHDIIYHHQFFFFFFPRNILSIGKILVMFGEYIFQVKTCLIKFVVKTCVFFLFIKADIWCFFTDNLLNNHLLSSCNQFPNFSKIFKILQIRHKIIIFTHYFIYI